MARKLYSTAAGTRLTATIRASRVIGLSTWSTVRKVKEASRLSRHLHFFSDALLPTVMEITPITMLLYAASISFPIRKEPSYRRVTPFCACCPALWHKLVQHTTLYNLMRSHLHVNKYIWYYVNITCLLYSQVTWLSSTFTRVRNIFIKVIRIMPACRVLDYSKETNSPQMFTQFQR